MLQNLGDSLHTDLAHVRIHWNRRMQSLRPSLSKTRRGAVGHTLACEDDERPTINIRVPKDRLLDLTGQARYRLPIPFRDLRLCTIVRGITFRNSENILMLRQSRHIEC